VGPRAGLGGFGEEKMHPYWDSNPRPSSPLTESVLTKLPPVFG